MPGQVHSPTPAQRKIRSSSWAPYSGRAGNSHAHQRAKDILHDLAGSGLRAAESELLGTNAAQLDSPQGNPKSGQRRRSVLGVSWEPCSLAKVLAQEQSEPTPESRMDGSTSPSTLSDADSLSQRSFSSLSSGLSSQQSSGMPLRPSSRLSKKPDPSLTKDSSMSVLSKQPDPPSHNKDDSMSVVAARRAIVSLNSIPIPTEDSGNSSSEVDEGSGLPSRPRSRLGHRSSSSLKAQPELPFEGAAGSSTTPSGSMSPTPPPQPPPPVPSKSFNSSRRRVASARPSLEESRDGEAPKPNRTSFTLLSEQHVRNPWEPRGMFRDTSLPPFSVSSSVSRQISHSSSSSSPVPRQISHGNGSRQAEAAAAAARLLCPGSPKETDGESKAARKIVQKAKSQGSLAPHAFPWRKSAPSNPIEDISSSAWQHLDLQDNAALERGVCDTAAPFPPAPATSSPKAVFCGRLMRHLLETQLVRSGASSVRKQSCSSCLLSQLSKDSDT